MTTSMRLGVSDCESKLAPSHNGTPRLVDDSRAQTMPKGEFPAVCMAATSPRGCAHVPCMLLLLLTHLRCAHCGGSVDYGERYFVLKRDEQRQPEIIAHELCDRMAR